MIKIDMWIYASKKTGIHRFFPILTMTQTLK